MAFQGIVSLIGLAMLVSCKNDIRTIQAFNLTDTIPGETARNVTMIYSDSSKVTTILSSRLLENIEGKEPAVEFPIGLNARFYDQERRITSTLRAGYGKSLSRQKLLEVRSDVVIINLEKKEQLNTEKLFWDQGKKMIYTDAYVKIKGPDKVIFGKGLEAEENLNKRTLKQISGELLVEDDR